MRAATRAATPEGRVANRIAASPRHGRTGTMTLRHDAFGGYAARTVRDSGLDRHRGHGRRLKAFESRLQRPVAIAWARLFGAVTRPFLPLSLIVLMITSSVSEYGWKEDEGSQVGETIRAYRSANGLSWQQEQVVVTQGPNGSRLVCDPSVVAGTDVFLFKTGV
jgi:hypothetical protein